MSSTNKKPPLGATRLRLPLRDLSAADFERLCLWLVRREGFEDVEHLGEAGSEQGRDIIAHRDGLRFAFQCKRVQRFTAADARREIEKVRGLPENEQPDVYVFVVSKAVRADTRKLARQAWGDAGNCKFWCGSELDERIKRHDEILEEFFGAKHHGEPPDPEIDAYRAWALERYQGLHLIGVGRGDVKVRLDEIYVPLRISHREEINFDQRSGKRRGELARDIGTGDVELEEIFDPELGDGHAIIFGEPGAGKTTALLKILHHCFSAGPESLGLDVGTIAFFLPLRRLAAEDLGQPLDVYLQRELSGELASGLVKRLWQRGRLVLLLDGLDEIGEEARRQEVCSYLEFQLAGAGRRQIRAVISCRYSGYGGKVKLGERYLHLDVRPLDAAQVRQLVRLWFREVQPRIANYSAAEARQHADELITALDGEGYSSQQLKVLVSSPLLLTLLCVVVLRGGEMPRHRVAFYDQCLRVLLSKWGKATKGKDPLLDVEMALAVLRPLAWQLHREGRRDDVSKAELLQHLGQRMRRLGHNTSPFRLLDWLHRETGTIDEYAPRLYGFMHLGLQEYLAAAHVASRGEALLPELSDTFDERWWREVILLLLGIPGQSVFAPFMKRVLATDALLEHATLLRECLSEAPEVILEPFLEVLDTATDPARQAAVLRLLRGRCDASLVERAQRLVGSEHPDLAALARQAVADCSEGAGAADRRTHDLSLLYLPTDAPVAAELAAQLEQRGLRLFETSDWESDLEAIVNGVRCLAVLVGPVAELPWDQPSRRACLEFLAAEGLRLAPVRLPGKEPLPELPTSIPWAPWVDVSHALDAQAADALERLVAGPQTETVARLPKTFKATATGEILVEPLTGLRMVWVPGGRFQMGGTAHSDEQPEHWVRVSPYWLGETPVTNAQYAVFLENTEREEPPYWRDRRFSDPAQPVVGVSWEDARLFCGWLSESLRETVTLPSEAQWEFAARGTDGRQYPWGTAAPDDTRACYGLDWEEGQPAQVGSHPAGKGPYGTLDQAGNVWEWCEDVWDDKVYRQRAARELLDPVATGGDEEIRVLRGGSWLNPAEDLRAAYRVRDRAAYRYRNIGFRVLAAPPSP